MNFKLAGDRPHIRLEEELASVDKKAADAAFRKHKREIIDPYMSAQGFLKYKSNAYVRKNSIDLLEYMDFQKEHYGSKTFTVNLAVMPLYIPHEFMVFGFSERLGKLICGRDIWWDFADETVCGKSMDNVRDAIGLFAVPWFRKMERERGIAMRLIRQKLTGGVSDYDQEWLSAIGSRSGRTAVIRENVKQLKLPESLIQE
ncbi:DUF4304 domain-containing protein [Dysosmobacter sp.]|uniref:DUF4304 domain-containing protein n=1 Tax=Dysosmobacter sp. TaxID=2591382 RepID=UPI002A8751CD|nr:DUF4304 domain-containing protein [Dysosmobacter sp.]MDY3281297.1 DUF4304 domain-containing protein [Dysosmobacter sp.]